MVFPKSDFVNRNVAVGGYEGGNLRMIEEPLESGHIVSGQDSRSFLRVVGQDNSRTRATN